jgi:hypothetical protein
MLHAIPNPKKNLSLDLSLDKVKTGVERISRLSNNKYKFTKSNAVFNQYTYEASEFLSLGVVIDINLSSINENKTDITIEIRRKVGTFNQPNEVTLANQHFDKIIDFISKGITMSDSDYSLLESTNTDQSASSKTGCVSVLRFFAWSIAVIFLLGGIAGASSSKIPIFVTLLWIFLSISIFYLLLRKKKNIIKS